MLDSGTTKRCAVRMGSTKLVKKVNINNFIANIVYYLPVRMRVRKFNKRNLMLLIHIAIENVDIILI